MLVPRTIRHDTVRMHALLLRPFVLIPRFSFKVAPQQIVLVVEYPSDTAVDAADLLPCLKSVNDVFESENSEEQVGRLGFDLEPCLLRRFVHLLDVLGVAAQSQINLTSSFESLELQ